MTEEAHQLRTLTRAIFAGFFESELVQPGLPQVRLVIFAFVALMFPATQIPMRAAQAYDAVSRVRPDVLDLFMWPHKLLFIIMAMVGTAAVSLVIWENVFPDRRDAFILGPLPIRTRTMVTARLGALAALMAMIALGASLPSALFYGLVAGGFSPGGILRTMASHFVATTGASAFAFLFLLSLQGLLINLVPARWLQRAMVLLQFVFVVAALEGLLLMQPVVHGLEQVMAPAGGIPAWMYWVPPAWFLALYEVLAGTTRPVQAYAVPAVVAVAVLFVLAFGLYAITFRRLMRRAVEAGDSERIGAADARDPLTARAGAALTRSPVAGAVCRFAVITLFRNRRHRLLLTIFAGVGTTAAFMSVLVPFTRGRLASMFGPDAVLPVGLVLIFFAVVGMRTLFAIPAEPSANWVFRLSDAEDARLHVRGAVAAIVALAVLPVIILLLPLHLYTQGAAVTLIHSALLLGAGWLLAEIVLHNFRSVPFTSAYTAPATRVSLRWPLWLAGFLMFSFTLSAVEARLLVRPLFAVLLVAGVGLAAAGFRAGRERELRRAPRMLTFDDQEDAPVTLELGMAQRSAGL